MSPKFWLYLGLDGAKLLDMEERPDLHEYVMMLVNDFQPIGWPSQDINREDGLTVPFWIINNCKFFCIQDDDPEILKFLRKIVEVGQQKVKLIEVQWDEDSVLVLKY